MRADVLAEPIAGLDAALAAADAFDQALVTGLLRPQPGRATGLTDLAQAVAGTPLAARVAEAAEKAAAGAAARTTSSPSPPPAPHCWGPSTTR